MAALCLAGVLCASGVPAAASSMDAELLRALTEARLREEAGDAPGAATALAQALVLAPQDAKLPEALFRQALIAGDRDRATALAQRLWRGGSRRVDVRLVMVADAVRRRDWNGARESARQTDQNSGSVPDWLTAPVEAWARVAEGRSDAAAPFNSPQMVRRRGAHADHHAALVSLVMNQVDESAILAGVLTIDTPAEVILASRLASGLAVAGQTAAAAALRDRIAAASGDVALTPAFAARLTAPVTPIQGMAVWMEAQASAFQAGGNRDLTLVLARAAHWLDPTDVSARLTASRALSAIGHDPLALSVLGTATDDIDVTALRRAELLADGGNRDAALTAAAKASAPDDAVEAVLVRHTALLRRLDARADEAQMLWRILERIERGQGNRTLLTPARMALADNMIATGDWPGARILLDLAVDEDGTNAALLNYAGYAALERRENLTLAQTRIKAAWAQDPDNAAYTDSLGWSHFVAGDFDKAVELLTTAARADTDNGVIQEHLGDALWQAGRRFEARYSWRAATQVSDDAAAVQRMNQKLTAGLTPGNTAP